MKTKLLGLIACMALLGSTVAANASPYVVTLEEVGSNVVATGSGAIDLTGLLFNGFGSTSPQLDASGGWIYTGLGSELDAYLGPIIGPSSFGSGGQVLADSGSGDMAGVDVGVPWIIVPMGYTSDSALSDGAIYDTATFASLGVTPGTYVWTWGTGADQRFTLEIGTTPLPAALPLFAAGLGAMGLLGWRRKRKNAAAA
ncbi:MAG: PEP-CTERM sorting domain-containing protein [Methylocella sp.]